MRVRLKRERLLAILGGSSLSQNHWALRLGFSRGHWSEIVNGKHPCPSARTRTRMLEVFGVELDELFAIESDPEPLADADFRSALRDRYLIDSELGQGRLGVVYLARDIRLGRPVVLQVISPEAVVRWASGWPQARSRRRRHSPSPRGLPEPWSTPTAAGSSTATSAPRACCSTARTPISSTSASPGPSNGRFSTGARRLLATPPGLPTDPAEWPDTPLALVAQLGASPQENP